MLIVRLFNISSVANQCLLPCKHHELFDLDIPSAAAAFASVQSVNKHWRRRDHGEQETPHRRVPVAFRVADMTYKCSLERIEPYWNGYFIKALRTGFKSFLFCQPLECGGRSRPLGWRVRAGTLAPHLAGVGYMTLGQVHGGGESASEGKAMSVISRAWPRVEEFWFDEPFPERGIDVAWLCQRASIPAHFDPKTKHTIVLDLTLPEEQLLGSVETNTRYEIRRAHKEALEFHPPRIPDPSALATFCRFYREFAALKGLPAVRLGYLRAAADAGALHLSGMAHGGEMVVWHSHLLIRARARLMHSVSFFRGQDAARRGMIGRANRLLHWLEIQAFRGLGATLYDFGGWYAGDSDQELLRINRFKEGFGGTIVTGFEAPVALTPLGRLYLRARQLRHRLRDLNRQVARNVAVFRRGPGVTRAGCAIPTLRYLSDWFGQ